MYLLSKMQMRTKSQAEFKLGISIAKYKTLLNLSKQTTCKNKKNDCKLCIQQKSTIKKILQTKNKKSNVFF